MKIRKEFHITFSKRFAEGSIFSASFSDAIERTVPDSADLKAENKKLMQEVVASVEKDIAAACETSKYGELVKNVIGTVKRAHKLEKRVQKTERKMQEFD